MARTMHDSTDVGDIPAKASMVAGYIDGRFQTVSALRKRFPKAQVVTVTVLGTPGADVCDTEPGNISISHAAKWAANEVTAGRRPTLYCMASQWDDVKAAVKTQGIAGKVSYWVAQYDGKAEVPVGAVAKQYADPKLSGGHFDLSVVADHWPGVDPDASSTPLVPATAEMVKKVTRHLAARTSPVGDGRHSLVDLRTQLDRVLSLD
jgi:hypothetical protein